MGDRVERLLMWLFAAWCVVQFVAEAFLMMNVLEADRNPLLLDEAIRTMLWVSVGPAVTFFLGAVLASARLSKRGQSDRWRFGVGTYAVLLVVVNGLGWI